MVRRITKHKGLFLKIGIKIAAIRKKEGEKMKKVRCRCKTNVRFARYGAKGSKSINYWKPCPIHDNEKEKGGVLCLGLLLKSLPM